MNKKITALTVMFLLLVPMAAAQITLDPKPAQPVEFTYFDAEIDKETGTLTLYRWGKEGVLKLRQSELPILSKTVTDKEELDYQGYKVQIYNTPTGIEYDLIIPSKPVNNVFTINVQSGYDWYYQPPYSWEYENGYCEEFDCDIVVNETHVTTKTGRVLLHRPNPYSYAVYNPDRQFNQWTTGKFCDVARPLVWDNKGLRTYADMLYFDDVLYLTVPRDFLEKAVYPVTIDPSFGFTSVGGSNWYPGNDTLTACNFTLTEAGTVTNVTAYYYSSAGDDYRTAVYYMNYTLAAQTEQINHNFGKGWGWEEFTVNGGGVSLPAGDYYVGIQADENGIIGLKYDAGAVNQAFTDPCDYDLGYPNPVVPSSWQNRKISIYVNYTAVGGTPVSLTVTEPGYGMYNRSDIPVELTITGTTRVWNVWLPNATWLYPANQSYVGATNMNLPINGTGFIFHAWASNATDTLHETRVFDNDLGAFVAANGTYTGIKAAVDACVANGGGNITIPKGVWNYSDGMGGSWQKITITNTHVEIHGYPNQRNSKGLIDTFNTVLNITVPTGNGTMFLIDGNNQFGGEFSNIEIHGYRWLNNTSKDRVTCFVLQDLLDFRFHHMKSLDTGSQLVSILSYSWIYPNRRWAGGLIDHCNATNIHGEITSGYLNSPCGYGVTGSFQMVQGYFEDNLLDVSAQFNNYTTWITDSYFRGWRHDISSNNGFIFDVYNCTFDYSTGFGTVDQHGYGDWDSVNNRLSNVGTRLMTIAQSTFKRPGQGTVPPLTASYTAWYIRGGAAISYNNTFEDYSTIYHLTDEDADYNGDEMTYPNHIYEWNNTYINCTSKWTVLGGQTAGQDYFENTSIPGYVAFTNPHPRSLGRNTDYKPVWDISGGLTVNEVHHGGSYTVAVETGYNTTFANYTCGLSTYWTDDVGLSKYWYETNTSGAFTTTPATAFGVGNWGNESITLNAIIGKIIWVRGIANDTAGNIAYTPYQVFTTTPPSTTPTCIITGPVNATRQNIGSQVNVTWSYNDLDGDAQGWYQVQVDDTAGFGSPTFDTGKLAGAVTVYTVTLSTTPNLYYMRVRVWDTDNNVSAYTAPRTAIADRVNITGLWVNDTTPYEGEPVEISCTAALAYDGHVLNGSAPSNDTLTLRSSLGDNIVMTYNGTHWVGSLTKTTVSTAIINNYQSVLETNYTITVLGMAGFSETIIWDVAPVTGGGGGSALLPLLVAVMMFAMGMTGGRRR